MNFCMKYFVVNIFLLFDFAHAISIASSEGQFVRAKLTRIHSFPDNDLQPSYSRRKTVKKVGIIGAGIAGLGFAASLKRMCPGVEDIAIFESRNSSYALTGSLGGGVQINGGAIVLEKLGCLPQIENFAQPIRKVISRSNTRTTLVDIDVQSLFREKAPNYMVSNSGKAKSYTIMRDALIEILYNATQSPSAPRDGSKDVRCSLTGIN